MQAWKRKEVQLLTQHAKMEWITANIFLAFNVELIKSGATEWNANLNPERQV